MLHLLVAHLLVHLMLDPTNLENGKMQARRRKTVQIIRQSAPTMPWCVHLLLQPCSFAAFVARAQGPGPYRPCARTGTGATEAIMPVCVVVYFSDIPRKYASPSSWPDNVCVRDIGGIPSATLAKDHQKWKMTLHPAWTHGRTQANMRRPRSRRRRSHRVWHFMLWLDGDEFNSPA